MVPDEKITRFYNKSFLLREGYSHLGRNTLAKSAPEVSFSIGSINYGTIDVGGSSAWQTYSIYQAGNSTSWANAINMSISFKESTNASEVRKESWVRVSTVSEDTMIESVGGNEAYVGSVVAATASTVIKTLVSVPAGATTAGRVAFFLHHRYQYTG